MDNSSWEELLVNPEYVTSNPTERITDHWHIFVRSTGMHWISYGSLSSLYQNNVLGLAVVSCELVPTVVYSDMIVSSDTNDRAPLGTTYLPNVMPVNDHFIVRNKNRNGIEIGLWDHVAGISHILLFPVHFDSMIPDLIVLTGRLTTINPGVSLSNGASARRIQSSDPYLFHLLAPTNLDPTMDSALHLYEVDPDGNLNPNPTIPNGSILSAVGVNYAMPTLISLSNGCSIITYRKISIGSAVGNDYGEIHRDIYDGATLLRSEPVFRQNGVGTDGANRPHTSLYHDAATGLLYLCTSWDQVDTSTGLDNHTCHLLVEELTLS